MSLISVLPDSLPLRNAKPATRLSKHECAGLFFKCFRRHVVSLPDKPSTACYCLEYNIFLRCGQTGTCGIVVPAFVMRSCFAADLSAGCLAEVRCLDEVLNAASGALQQSSREISSKTPGYARRFPHACFL
jgi:hypothetical protein